MFCWLLHSVVREDKTYLMSVLKARHSEAYIGIGKVGLMSKPGAHLVLYCPKAKNGFYIIIKWLWQLGGKKGRKGYEVICGL